MIYRRFEKFKSIYLPFFKCFFLIDSDRKLFPYDPTLFHNRSQKFYFKCLLNNIKY